MMSFLGIDCATKLNDVSAKGLKDAGITHVGRYLGHSWKGLSLDEVKSISNAGLQLFSIFETNPTKTTYFTNAQGIQDAKDAMSYAKELQQPKGSAIYFTVDFDGNSSLPQVEDYFKGVKDTLQGYKVGGYGSFDVVTDLKSKGLIEKVFQTYAWSGGKENKDNDIFQHLNGQSVAGISVDLDDINGDIGAWSLRVIIVEFQPVDKPKKESIVTKVEKVIENIIHHPRHYSVSKGESFWSIEEKFNFPHGELEKLNPNLDPTKLRIGQMIRIPGETTSHVVKKSSSNRTYTAKSGDSLSKIASEHGMSLAEIEKLNPQIKDFDVIQIGEQVNIK